MIIKFDAIGISWEADVDYTPPGPPVRMFVDTEPPDEEELEIVAIWNQHTQNARWLLDSEVSEELYDAATEAAREAHLSGRAVFDEP